MKQLVVGQPYVPTYRVPFFEGLVSELGENRIECRVQAGQSTGTQRHLNDAASADGIVDRGLWFLRAILIGLRWSSPSSVVSGIALRPRNLNSTIASCVTAILNCTIGQNRDHARIQLD